MDQAQGAIDAARAAGADRYAAAEYAATTKSLASANDAVAVRDYRLALNHALESRGHAQNAAREGADNKARLRSEVERAMADIAGLLADATTKIETAGKARGPRQVLRPLQATLTAVNVDVQKAGEAVKVDDYQVAQQALSGVRQRIEEVIATLDARAGAQSTRTRR